MSEVFPVQPITPGPLSQIARALEARLQLVFPLTRFQYEFMPPRVTAEGWRNLMRKTPFVGIGWNVLADSKGGRVFTGASKWSVFLVTRNQASIAARYYGDKQGPGLFTMVQAAVGLLHGYTIKGFGSVQVTQAANAFAESWDDDTAMAIVDLQVGTTVELPDVVTAPGDLGLFREMFATWNLAGVDEAMDQVNVGDWGADG